MYTFYGKPKVVRW